MPDPHLIERQVLELRFRTSASPQETEREVTGLFRDCGPTLQRAFDRLAPKGIYRFDKVEVDLGRLDLAAVNSTLLTGLEEAVVRRLRQLVRNANRGESGNSKGSPDCASVSPADESSVGEYGFDERVDRAPSLNEHTDLQAFVEHFLSRGVSPWWGAARYRGAPDFASELGEKIRVAFQTSASFRRAVVRALSDNPRRVLHRLTSERWLEPLAEQLRVVARSSLQAPAQMRPISDPISKRSSKLLHGWTDSSPTDAHMELVRGLLASVDRPELDRVSSAPGNSHSITQESGDALDESGGSMLDVEVATDKPQGHEDRETATFVEDAGIVLLQPFLPLLFTALDLADSTAFVSERARSKAIRVLEYLAWGTQERAEFALRLQKILCEHPPDEPLERVRLTDGEMCEADRVLDAVIGHWSALKRTGREGLREMFLQRAGKIEVHDGGMTMVVERQAADILLNKLPWSYSVVRLPWMTQPMTVQWT